MIRRSTIIAAVLIIALSAFGVLFLNRQAKALTQAGSWPITGTPADVGLSYEEVMLSTEDGLGISGWYISGVKPSAIVVVHGIYANKQAVLPVVVMLAEAGYHVLTIDMRGHGASEGEKISYGYFEALDVQAAVSYLKSQPDIEHVGAIGYSLGGAAVVRAAKIEDSLEAIVVESSFSSLAEAVDDGFSEHTGLPGWPVAPLLVKFAERELEVSIEQINSAQNLATMTPRPVLIIHGSEDDLFPVKHAHQLFEAAQSPKELWVIDGLGHDYPLKHEAAYRKYVLKFFEQAF